MTTPEPAVSQISWGELRARAERALVAARLASPDAEARWMLETVSGRSGANLVAASREQVPVVAVARLDTMLERRIAGEPLQYVVGSWPFRGLDLFVDPRVLIPRPETETTAQVAIDEARRLGARTGPPDPWSGTHTEYAVADLGTGSGAIALALATELPDAEVWATDASADALAVARANLAGVGAAATRVRLVEGDWLAALPRHLRGTLRVVVSNPPYVAEREVADLPPEVAAHEPMGALVSGPTGLEAIEHVVRGAYSWLARGAALVCELAPHRADDVAAIARDAGYAEIEVRPDLTGRPRVLTARRS